MALDTADRVEIQDLLSRYCIAIDTDDGGTGVELFAPGGGWIAPRGAVPDAGENLRSTSRARTSRLQADFVFRSAERRDSPRLKGDSLNG